MGELRLDLDVDILVATNFSCMESLEILYRLAIVFILMPIIVCKYQEPSLRNRSETKRNRRDNKSGWPSSWVKLWKGFPSHPLPPQFTRSAAPLSV